MAAISRTQTNDPLIPVGNDIPVAQIGQLKLAPNTPVTLNNESGNSIYNVTLIDINYENDQHILQLPVTSINGTSCNFAYVASQTMKKIVTFAFDNSITWPKLPAIYSGDPNEILLMYEIMPGSLDVESDALNVKYVVKGKYTYGFADTSKVKLYAGVLPFMNITLSESEIPAASFIGGLTSEGSSKAINEGPGHVV